MVIEWQFAFWISVTGFRISDCGFPYWIAVGIAIAIWIAGGFWIYRSRRLVMPGRCPISKWS